MLSRWLRHKLCARCVYPACGESSYASAADSRLLSLMLLHWRDEDARRSSESGAVHRPSGSTATSCSSPPPAARPGPRHPGLPVYPRRALRDRRVGEHRRNLVDRLTRQHRLQL